jgi:hypothetical protein
MLSRFFISSLLVTLLTLSNAVFAANGNNPFDKTETLGVGKNISWNIDKAAGSARKSVAGNDNVFYHLTFDNAKLVLLVSTDKAGLKPKTFNQLNIKDLTFDGKRSSLFQWCLSNQEDHSRFLQEGLKVKNNICVTDGQAGTFVMLLDRSTLKLLKSAKQMAIMLKPFRTPLEIQYDLADFDDMYSTLNAKPAAPVVPVAAGTVVQTAASKPVVAARKMCSMTAPAKYKSIKPVSYQCSDAAAKQAAKHKVDAQVKRQVEAEAKQKKLAEEKRKQEEAARLKLEEKQRAEAAAIAASQAKQAQISGEIAEKMLKVCEKYWQKGEHRCYCQKYIDHAPAEIQASSTCE